MISRLPTVRRRRNAVPISLYIALLLIRLYFALQPSYLHPDEHFQGPQVIAASIFSLPALLTWEFTVDAPIRSVFSLWLTYGPPLTALKTIYAMLGRIVSRAAMFYTLRLSMFAYTLLADVAILELAGPRALLLVSSSYVTWTWQTHTFSNSIETLLVVWCLVLVNRLRLSRKPQVLTCASLASLCVLGTFTRITFPAFLLPGVILIPYFGAQPRSLIGLLIAAVLTTLAAVTADSYYYGKMTFTPWNNIMYNIDSTNLAQHGLHPRYQHILINLPQLLGPAIVMLRPGRSLLLLSAISATVVLSLFQHQEARFLIPTVALYLSTLRIRSRAWIATWLGFNMVLGTLMGIYHQGGVVPAQIWLNDNSLPVFWWRTLSPPPYLGRLGFDLMGMPAGNVGVELDRTIACDSSGMLVVPTSTTFDFPGYASKQVWLHRHHLNLDDLDFDDGIMPELNRVIGHRGLGIYELHRTC